MSWKREIPSANILKQIPRPRAYTYPSPPPSPLTSENEDLSGYEDEDEAPVAVAPPITKKQAALRLAANAGKKSLPAKIPPQKTPPNDKLAKAVVIHGFPCQRPMADIIQDIGVRGIMGARWLLGSNRRLGKATSSVVVFFDRKLAVGSHLKMRGRWLPIEAYGFNRGK
ncbi:hypothetical protein EV426DRAFT_709757 [Tirmania nivea]|nr:hypothetical protein EV426DRAFT_709757 [Tirmania nivea]